MRFGIGGTPSVFLLNTCFFRFFFSPFIVTSSNVCAIQPFNSKSCENQQSWFRNSCGNRGYRTLDVMQLCCSGKKRLSGNQLGRFEFGICHRWKHVKGKDQEGGCSRNEGLVWGRSQALDPNAQNSPHKDPSPA